MRRPLSVLVALTLAVVLSGCGGGPNPATRPGDTHPFDLGAVRGEVATAAGFNMLPFDAGPNQPVAFTCLYGARIVSLDEWGYGQLAVASVDGGRYGIFSITADGYRRTAIINSNQRDWQPAVSPDGRKIAYTREFGVNHADIYVINADGSGNTNLTVTGYYDQSPTWDPRGERIAFTSDRTDNVDRLYVVNVDGTGLTQITDYPAFFPAWSPDGKTIAFSEYDPVRGYDLLTCTPTGDHFIRLTSTDSVNETHPSWSPDGRQIAYQRAASGALPITQVWVMDADGGNKRSLTQHLPELYDCGDPSWSPDGRRIAVTRVVVTDNAIDLIDLSTGLVSHVTYGSEYHPDWFPTPGILRRLVGPNGSDYGATPPLGEDSPMVIVGITRDGLASAATIGTGSAYQPTLSAEVLPHTGSELAGLAVTGGKIRKVQEDAGRGMPPRVWFLVGSGLVKQVVIYFSGETGRIVSIIAGSDVVFGGNAASGDTISLRGALTEAYDDRDPTINRLAAEAAEVVLDASTGAVISHRRP